MNLLTLLHFVWTMLLSLQLTIQAKKLSDLYNAAVPMPSGRTVSPRTVRNAPPQPPEDDLNTTRGFLVEYTLTTANSPDCDRSLVDNFPVRVQYRVLTYPSESVMNGDSLVDDQPGNVTEWKGSPNTPALMQGENCLFNAYSISVTISKMLQWLFQ